VAVQDDLQIEKPRGEADERKHDDEAGECQPAPEQEQFALGILEFARAETRAGIVTAPFRREQQPASHRASQDPESGLTARPTNAPDAAAIEG